MSRKKRIEDSSKQMKIERLTHDVKVRKRRLIRYSIMLILIIIAIVLDYGILENRETPTIFVGGLVLGAWISSLVGYALDRRELNKLCK